MRIAAIGDAHLGRAYLPVTAPNGVNQRELDFDEAFKGAVELALSLEPDLVVWLGDIFDHPRPTYRSFRVAQQQLARMRDYGVPLVAITGNHDTPRLPGTGSPYSVLADAFPEMNFAYRMGYERFEVGEVVLHAVPQMLTVEATLDALDQADKGRSLDRTNVLLAHPLVPSVERRYADVNEIEVDAGRLRSDLVVLGHYHVHTEVAPRTWYAGSTDSFTFADDPERPKGLVLLDTDSGECRHVPVPGRRPLVTLEAVHALGSSPAEVSAAVLERAATAPAGAVARLYVNHVDPEAWKLLDLNAVRDAASAALHLKVEPSFLPVGQPVELPELDSVPSQWARYVEAQDLTGFDRARIRRLGEEALARAVEEAQ